MLVAETGVNLDGRGNTWEKHRIEFFQKDIEVSEIGHAEQIACTVIYAVNNI